MLAALKRRWVFVGAISVLVLGLLTWLIAGFMAPASWQLSLEGKSELVSMQLVGKTQWDIGTGIVCVQPQDAVVAKSFGDDAAVCEGRLSHPLGGASGVQGRALDLLGTLGNEIHATIATYHDGSVQMSLRAKDRAHSLGQLYALDDEDTLIDLPSGINIIWDTALESGMRRTVVLPFTGDMTIGRDVSWSTEKMLLAGRLSIFAASEESLTGRTLAEEAVLLLGDQVQLKGHARDGNTFITPKGFIRFGLGSVQQPSVLDVVAFAPAEGATIMRFGGGEYGFSPGWWARIKHKSTLVITLAVLAALLTFLASLANILQFLPVAWMWCSKRK